jgi:hypothetical protein
MCPPLLPLSSPPGGLTIATTLHLYTGTTWLRLLHFRIHFLQESALRLGLSATQVSVLCVYPLKMVNVLGFVCPDYPPLSV